MQNTTRKARIWNGVEIGLICLFCAFTLLLDFIQIPYVEEAYRNRMLSKIIQQSCGSIAAVLVLRRLGVRLFGKIRNWLYLIPCLLIGVDNFQFFAYFSGKMQLVYTEPLDWLLFIGYCLGIGLFEELIFRGVLFQVFAGMFSADRKGFLKTYVISSVVFGVSHLLNGFTPAVFLQVGYTVLTGGLFAFCLIKTKNILCCAFVHALYNFCGLLFDTQGLGTGVVMDTGTAITMLIVSVAVGVFVLYKVWTYGDEERVELYNRLGIKSSKKQEEKTEEV